eukprot:jgi/Orpsp1_1/1177870/evm.model.c7180000063172.1
MVNAKTIFITGSNSGIGKETVKYFANKGWNVIATMRSVEKAGELADLPNVTIMPLDISNSQQVKETCQKALEQFDVDVLLNNAAFGMIGPFEELPENEIRKVFDTNVIGTILVTQQFIPYFKNRKSGVILFTTSLAGIISLPFESIYGATKHALQGIIETLYYELKPYNIQVKSMIPGGTKTEFKTKIPVLIYQGHEMLLRNKAMLLLDGDRDFPEAAEAAEVMYTAATDGEDKINYPTDHICKRLLERFNDMGLEEFKKDF